VLQAVTGQSEVVGCQLTAADAQARTDWGVSGLLIKQRTWQLSPAIHDLARRRPRQVADWKDRTGPSIVRGLGRYPST